MIAHPLGTSSIGELNVLGFMLAVLAALLLIGVGRGEVGHEPLARLTAPSTERGAPARRDR